MIKNKNTFLIFFTLFSQIIFSGCTKPGSKHDSTPQTSNLIQQSCLPKGWYNDNPAELNTEISFYFDEAAKYFDVAIDNNEIKAMIVPHAGYYYSGLCAASAYRLLLNKDGSKNDKISRVIIVSPSHRFFLHNIALPDYNIYRTCLGDIEVDVQAIRVLGKASSVFQTYSEAHKLEHAIEVQLPFLQKTINKFKIVPLISGELSYASFHHALDALKKIINKETLLVVSSDFTHFGKIYEFIPFSKLIFNQLKYLDSLAIQQITSLSGCDFEQVIKDTSATICGHIPINIFLGLTQMGIFQNLTPMLTCYYNSAQMVKARGNNSINIDKLIGTLSDSECENCVGYAGIVFSSQNAVPVTPEKQLSEYDKIGLLKLARHAIENRFKAADEKLPDHLIYPIITPALLQASGAFVTLNTKSGKLRGCIGQILTNKPIYQTIAEMAQAAAFHDSRFSPLKKEELDNIKIDITILTMPRMVSSYEDIQVGRDGIILKKIGTNKEEIASAVFLPQVAKQFGWDIQTTLEQLSLKAGLSKDSWRSNCEFEVFEGFEISEK